MSSKPPRDLVQRSSRQYYAHRAYYYDLLSQRRPFDKLLRRDLALLDFLFKNKAAPQVKRVLDVACGGGTRSESCSEGLSVHWKRDSTPERVEVARKRAARSNVTVELSEGDPTKLRYRGQFEPVLALDLLFLFPATRK